MKFVLIIGILMIIELVDSWKIETWKSSKLLQRIKRFTITTGIVSQTIFSGISSPALTSPVIADVSSTTSVSSGFNTYKNDQFRYSFEYPKDWQENEISISRQDRMKVFVDPTDKDTSVTVLTKFIPADFTSLGSFGGPDSLKLFILPRDEKITTNIIEERKNGNIYSLEYTIDSPDNPVRHVYNSFALQPTESLISLLIQTPEERFQQNQVKFTTIRDSFRLFKAQESQ